MNIVRKEAFYKSCNGANSIRALIWNDEDAEPRGIIQIAHGLSEHIGRYDEFARYLVTLGFIVCGNDHLGHGKSVECPDDLGFVCEGDHVNMVRDMNTLQRIMSKKYPSLPYIIFGHSMGSLLARIYASAFGDELAGAIFCGTAQLPKPVLLLEDPVDYLLKKLPENQNSADTMSSLFGKFTQKLLKDDDQLAWLSKSETNRENYRNDPLCGVPMGNTLARELVTMAVKVSYPDWAMKLPYGFHVLLISGAKDPVGMFGRGVLAVSDELVQSGIEPEVILYPADRHEIINEDDRDKVYKDVGKFLEKVLNEI